MRILALTYISLHTPRPELNAILLLLRNSAVPYKRRKMSGQTIMDNLTSTCSAFKKEDNISSVTLQSTQQNLKIMPLLSQSTEKIKFEMSHILSFSFNKKL